MSVMVNLDNSNLDCLTDCEHFRRMVDATPCDVGHMQQAVNATEIDKGTVISDIFNNAVDDLTFFKVGDDLVTLLSATFFQYSSTRHNDVAATTIHFQDVERLWHIHQGASVANRANIYLTAR